jgi:hypothetical protein
MEEAAIDPRALRVGPTKQEVVEKLQKMGAFLHGSRDRFKNYNYDDPTDWDFAVDDKEFGWNETGNNWFDGYWHDASPLGNFIQHDFVKQNKIHFLDEEVEYGDDYLIALYHHIIYPDITIQVKPNLNLWKKIWYRTPTWYWEKFLWKSAPHAKEYVRLNPDKEQELKKFMRETWNMLWEVHSHKDLNDYV